MDGVSAMRMLYDDVSELVKVHGCGGWRLVSHVKQSVRLRLKKKVAYLSVTNSSQNNRRFLDVSTTLSNMYVFSSCMPRI